MINVNPNKPCWSILALEKLWKNVNFRISTYVHSSVKSSVPEEFKRNTVDDKTNVINVTLIWKEGKHLFAYFRVYFKFVKY